MPRSLIVIAITALCCLVLSEPVIRAAEPKFNAGKAIRAAAGLLEKDHLRQWPLDDKLSRRWLASLIQRLDPDAMLFLQADRDEFEKYADRLDDFAREENLEFANLLRQRYQERWTQAAKLAERQLAAKHDFTIDEAVPRQYEKPAADEQELEERWRKRIKLELLIEKQHGRELSEVKTQLASRYDRLRRQAAEIDDEQWSAKYIQALLSAYEPQAWYFSETEVRRYDIGGMKLREFNLNIRYRIAGEKFLLVVMPGHSLRWNQKLVGQQLLAIRRTNGEIFDLVGLPENELWHLIRRLDGPLAMDTEVILELLDPVTLERMSVKCSRYEHRRS